MTKDMGMNPKSAANVAKKYDTEGVTEADLARGLRRDGFWVAGSLLLLMMAWAKGLFWVGADVDQGQVYRIIYVHVPVAWNAFLWVILSAVFSAVGLARRHKLPALDLSSQAALEIGTLFAGLSLLTGMIWGRPTWGVWWDWDPRLVSTLVMFLVCLGYHLLRSFTPDVRVRRLVAAAVSLLAAINVPIVYYSVNIWRSIHQPQTFTRAESTASGDVVVTLLVNVLGMMIVGYALYRLRRGGLSVRQALEQARQG
jgi:heme exporter protein C